MYIGTLYMSGRCVSIYIAAVFLWKRTARGRLIHCQFRRCAFVFVVVLCHGFQEGYDADVGEKSALLSGGQKQVLMRPYQFGRCSIFVFVLISKKLITLVLLIRDY